MAGVRVLDFSRVLAGPYATRILADFGAEVIKVQSKKTATGAEDNNGPYFKAWNRNKRSVTLDMSRPWGKRDGPETRVHKRRCCGEFFPTRHGKLGTELRKTDRGEGKPRHVEHVRHGTDWPVEELVAFGPTVQSLGGLTYLTSYAQDSPVGIGYAYADVIAGLYGAVAILAALESRDRTGAASTLTYQNTKPCAPRSGRPC